MFFYFKLLTKINNYINFSSIIQLCAAVIKPRAINMV